MMQNVYIYGGIALVALVIGSAGGFAAGTWRAESACGDKTLELSKRIAELGDEVTALTEDKAELKIAIEKANGELKAAEAQTIAAQAAREQALRHAGDLAAFSQSRMDKLAKAVESATSCGDVLNSYWELRK